MTFSEGRERGHEIFDALVLPPRAGEHDARRARIVASFGSGGVDRISARSNPSDGRWLSIEIRDEPLLVLVIQAEDVIRAAQRELARPQCGWWIRDPRPPAGRLAAKAPFLFRQFPGATLQAMTRHDDRC